MVKLLLKLHTGENRIELFFLKTNVVTEQQLTTNLTGGELSPLLRMGVKSEKFERDSYFLK